MSISENSPSTTTSQTPIVEPSSSYLPPLLAYFRSGWAFLIPYLAAYLLYAWLKWPANPEGIGRTISESGAIFSWRWIVAPPSLLYVYWFLHALHLLLGVIALRGWWRNTTPQGDLARQHPVRSRLRSTIPWILLALLFWIPSTYLEWPSDPWEHLRRITGWAAQPTLGEYSAGYKSFYFFAFSFVGHVLPNQQLFWLNIYYTATCFLVIWQNYRLAGVAGLDSRWAFLFVAINALTFGNSCFSFYRYYGLASTMFAQVGATALTRIVLEASIASGRWAPKIARIPHSRLRASLFFTVLLPCVALCVLVGFNHLQGLGIAALAAASIVTWRLLCWKRSTLWILLGAAGTLSLATILWWPRQPTLDLLYRPQGWLSPLYGFNFLDWTSPAAERLKDIFGYLGFINLAAGIWLLHKNHVVGWLTAGPLFYLSLPILAVPIANSLSQASANGGYIIAYHRMLFAIPMGLSLVVLVRDLCAHATTNANPSLIQKCSSILFAPYTAVIVSLTFLLTVPATRPFFNRTWQSLARYPDDLNFRHAWKCLYDLPKDGAVESPLIAATTANIFIVNIHDPTRHLLVKSWVVRHYENIGRTPVDDFDLICSAAKKPPYPAILTTNARTFFTPYSQAAVCSNHWSPQVAALSTAGNPELTSLAGEHRMRQNNLGDGAILWFPTP